MKRLLAVGAILLGTLTGPTAVFADNGLELSADEAPADLGAVVTNAVTGPITIGGITYVPGGDATGGAAGGLLNGVIQAIIVNAHLG